jgi:hypothetical protein
MQSSPSTCQIAARGFNGSSAAQNFPPCARRFRTVGMPVQLRDLDTLKVKRT